MSNSISQEFRLFSLLRFALPSMIMMVFMSLYTIIDGIFVSRLVGSEALSAINIVFPVLNVLIAVGIMLASGGSQKKLFYDRDHWRSVRSSNDDLGKSGNYTDCKHAWLYSVN